MNAARAGGIALEIRFNTRFYVDRSDLSSSSTWKCCSSTLGGEPEIAGDVRLDRDGGVRDHSGDRIGLRLGEGGSGMDQAESGVQGLPASQTSPTELNLREKVIT